MKYLVHCYRIDLFFVGTSKEYLYEHSLLALLRKGLYCVLKKDPASEEFRPKIRTMMELYNYLQYLLPLNN